MLRRFILWGIRNRIRGFGWVVKQLFRNAKIRVQNTFGVWFYADPYEKIDNCIITGGYFDLDVIHSLREQLRPDDRYWDIGANIGLHALTVKHLHPNVKCVCFEPYFENFKSLINNIQLNGMEMQCYNMALHSEASTHELYTIPGNIGATGFYQVKRTISTGFMIAAITGDWLIENGGLEVPQVIKIDTEGNEIHVLNGMKSILSSPLLRAIILEVNQDKEAITALLEEYGFTMRRLSEAPNYIATRTK